MKYLLSYKLYEFVETRTNTTVLYQDDDIEVKLVKTFDACKHQNKNTSWCSSDEDGFYSHNKTANMYRINFKDGYKLRLTYDYTGETHWGQGGIINGERLPYIYTFPKSDDPFNVRSRSESYDEFIRRIVSLPEKAKDAIRKHHDGNSMTKSANLINLYNEINKIKVLNASNVRSNTPLRYVNIGDNLISIEIEYNNEVYNLLMNRYEFVENDNLRRFLKGFKNKYAFHDNTLFLYLMGKAKKILS